MAELRLAVQGHGRFEGLPARTTLARWVGRSIERDAEITLRFVGVGRSIERDAEITLRFVGAAEGRRLNRDYRGSDYATNVLTFDYAAAPAVQSDIVLCVPVIRRATTSPTCWCTACCTRTATGTTATATRRGCSGARSRCWPRWELPIRTAERPRGGTGASPVPARTSVFTITKTALPQGGGSGVRRLRGFRHARRQRLWLCCALRNCRAAAAARHR